jgi:hypothetical protein
MQKNASIIFLFFAAILVSLPVYLFVLWIEANTYTNGYPANQQLYEQWLPGFLKGRYASSFYGFLFASAALLLSIFCTRTANKYLRAIAILLIIISGLMAFANLWSMM